MGSDHGDARTSTLDPRERLEAVLGRAGSARSDDGQAEPSSAWTTWIDETATGDAHHAVAPTPAQLRGPRRWLPVAVRGARIDPGRRGAAVLVAAAVGAAVLAGFLVWGGRPRAEPIGALPVVSVGSQPTGTSPPSGTPSATPSAAPAQLVVSVVGKVVRPGLVTVLDGARVADVLAAAGGALPGVDLSRLNLARKVSDGEQIAVDVPAAPDAQPAAGGSAAGAPAAAASPAGPIDLNAASADQLDTLPGVGPVTAQRIVEWRTRNGRFSRVEQLREIDGIGERRFEQLRGLVRV